MEEYIGDGSNGLKTGRFHRKVHGRRVENISYLLFGQVIRGINEAELGYDELVLTALPS